MKSFKKKKNSCSSSTASTTRTSCSSSSANSSALPPPPVPVPGLISSRRSMDEVWNDINNLAALPAAAAFTPSSSSASIIIANSNNNNSILHEYHRHHQHGHHQIQDLLAGAFMRDDAAGRGGTAQRSGSGMSSWIPVRGTALRLSSSALELQRSSNSSSVSSGAAAAAPILQQQQQPSNAAGVLSNISFSWSKKEIIRDIECRPPEVGRHLKRMIKNRESAARSRARKQAYTNELEMEVAHLIKENAKLTKQLEEVRRAMVWNPPTKKAQLKRTSTAPF